MFELNTQILKSKSQYIEIYIDLKYFVQNICVNYKKVNIPGFQVSNDFFKSNIRQNFQTNRIKRMKPNHLEVNYKTLKAVVLYEPQQIQFPYKIDLDLLD
ncbi:hypothetical protein MARPO_0167s0029 [Marchantia polymorpha]|uniref:Uncharacterized protein n=1 Tax=Marchantia polymorpha TaxID=3197 RepID=A0A2R6W3A0_MARPO|nr:hypothetical protein MARPO_0167s0029 [Marchantia polymorpha]|eukprot:PTQ28339.1 hypothetical protein MARPO_0167s0029 [Marchantia polymorpha]